MKKKKAFTLAEILITLAIIGVVAVMTIPTLIAKINNIVDTNRKEVVEDRLIQGLNMLNTVEDGFNASQYSKTVDFVNALSKYYKMSKICAAENLKDCFPYKSVIYTKKDNKETTKVWDNFKAPEDFGLKSDEYFSPAGFISAQGTPFVMLLKRDCIMDSEKAIDSIPTNCVQYVYDNNGSNKPNKVGKDLVTSNSIRIGFVPPDGTFDVPIGNYDTYYILGKVTDSINTCNDSEDKVWDTRGSGNPSCANNKWAAAKKACSDAGYVFAGGNQLRETLCRINYPTCNGTQYTCNSSIGTDEKLVAKIREKASLSGPFWSGAAIYESNASMLQSNGCGNNYPVKSDFYTICLGSSQDN